MQKKRNGKERKEREKKKKKKEKISEDMKAGKKSV